MSSSKCLICILTPILIFASIVGNTSFFFKCFHQGGKNYAHFSYSKIRMLIPFFLSIFILSVFFYNIYTLCTIGETHLKPLPIARELIDTFVCLITGTIIFLSSLKIHLRLHEYQGLFYIFQYGNTYGVNNILPTPVAKHLRKVSLIFSYILSGLLLGFFIYLVRIGPEILTFYVARTISVFVGTFTFLIATFLYYFESNLYVCALNACYKQIKLVLKKKNCFPSSKRNLVPELKVLRLLNSLVLKNLRIFQRFADPNLVMLLAISTLILVLNIFVICKIVFYGIDESMDMQYVMLILLASFITISMGYALTFIENLKSPGEDIQSFLFRYPISKLTPAEAAQVEMLITTLNIQKPVLKASDIFTVGTRLIASITGTVVTYVLVALQFKAAWTKE